MNENLEKDKIQLGNEKPQLLLPSKSLLNTIKLGYDTKPVPPPPENHIDFIEGDSVMTTISTGFEHNDKPVPPPPEINLSCKTPKHKNPDSVIGSVDTGFGCDNQLIRECPKPKYKTHLCKENYLGTRKQWAYLPMPNMFIRPVTTSTGFPSKTKPDCFTQRTASEH